MILVHQELLQIKSRVNASSFLRNAKPAMSYLWTGLSALFVQRARSAQTAKNVTFVRLEPSVHPTEQHLVLHAKETILLEPEPRNASLAKMVPNPTATNLIVFFVLQDPSAPTAKNANYAPWVPSQTNLVNPFVLSAKRMKFRALVQPRVGFVKMVSSQPWTRTNAFRAQLECLVFRVLGVLPALQAARRHLAQLLVPRAPRASSLLLDQLIVHPVSLASNRTLIVVNHAHLDTLVLMESRVKRAHLVPSPVLRRPVVPHAQKIQFLGPRQLNANNVNELK